MNIQLLEAAESELVDAIRFYNREREGLGYEFALEVRRTLGRIAEFPQALHPLHALPISPPAALHSPSSCTPIGLRGPSSPCISLFSLAEALLGPFSIPRFGL